MTKFFHTSVFLPDHLLAQLSGRYLRLHYTARAHEQALSYQPALTFLGSLTLLKKDIVEISTDDGEITSLIARISCGARGDMLLALDPDFSQCAASVTAVWLNKKGSTAPMNANRRAPQYEYAPGVRANVLPNPVWGLASLEEVAV